MKTLAKFLILPLAFITVSCANQLPPPGGEDDREPPKILTVSPSPGKTNFKGREIVLKFNEYVDKRSFIESFNIYPETKAKSDFSWSGKEVTITFDKPLDANTTYVISIGRDLKDIRGGNALTLPVVYAFSTGSRIDSGKISGTLISDRLDRTKLLLYRISSSDITDPSKQKADYIIQPGNNGVYLFAYLPDGKYRVLGLYDEDRNSLFSESTEKLAIPQSDVEIRNGSSVSDVDLIITKLFADPTEASFLNTLSPDSTDLIYSNISDDAGHFETNSKLFFWFRNNELAKESIVSGFALTDSATGKAYKPVFNWFNDSLLEVFLFEKFTAGSTVDLKIDLKQHKPPVYFRRTLHISDKPSVSVVSGKIAMNDSSERNVKLILAGTAGSFITFRTDPDEEGRFEIKNIPEGTYRLIAFLDDNDNDIPDTGSYKPFKYAEKIRVYEKEIKVKSGWNVEDIVVEF